MQITFFNVNRFVLLWSFEPHKPSTKAYEPHISENLIYSWPGIANSKTFAVTVENRIWVNFSHKKW